MKQASKFPGEGVLMEVRQPVDAEHYTQIAKATAQALADEIARRAAQRHPGDWIDLDVHQAAAQTLIEWFTGKFTPGITTTKIADDCTTSIKITLTDPPDGAPAQKPK